jgi:hypothetical protein
VVDLPPEVQAALDHQEASLQRIAMWVVSLPIDRRDEVFEHCKKRFESTVDKHLIRPEIGRQWVDLTIQRLHSLVLSMDVGDGGGHA